MEVARIFLADGNYKWNSGMFIFSVKTIWKEMRRQNLSLFTFAETIAKRWNMEGFSAVRQEEFKKLPKISFDYAIMEHAQEVLVSDANFDWDDIGNWTAISNHYEHDDANNVIHANAELLDCHDCIVFSHDKEKLITGIDLHGLVVVQTPDATLVAQALPPDRNDNSSSCFGWQPTEHRFYPPGRSPPLQPDRFPHWN